MTTCSFILSTGRTSTENIAAIAGRAHPDAKVEHEGLGSEYFSRRVYRRPGKFAQVLGSHVPLQRKLIEIEDMITQGTRYLDVGWPCYAWLPYFSKRFSSRLRFAHLVRNPFHVAASLTTHGLFNPEIRAGRRWERIAMIHVDDPRVKYSKFAAVAEGFTPFERNLFHWLELNEFMIEQHEREGFVGVFRFEELYEGQHPTVTVLLDQLVSKAQYDLNARAVDSVHRKLPAQIREPNSQLVEAVIEVGTRLGYSEEYLRNSASVEELNERYSRKRL
ncbi:MULTISPECIES: hypothetical protein [unclassified Ruegeria]|uniref:hypothetical protein n=1 Tax=unclassified Ruegeria TaxID=2625375 RepID=UPI001487FE85|nr:MULTISPECIES: hypothetical protein [unclassified Ruegeria]